MMSKHHSLSKGGYTLQGCNKHSASITYSNANSSTLIIYIVPVCCVTACLCVYCVVPTCICTNLLNLWRILILKIIVVIIIIYLLIFIY